MGTHGDTSRETLLASQSELISAIKNALSQPIPNFGKMLMQIRRERQVTVRSLAKKVRLTKSYISAIENGHKKPPPVANILNLAKALNAPADVLVLAACLDRISALARKESLKYSMPL